MPKASDEVIRHDFGIYLHWPFCRSKCPYCDFSSQVATTIDHERWARAYVRELATQADAFSHLGRVGSVFFGGGTPSLMAPATIAAVLEAIGRHWPLAAGLEVTLEANPTSVEAARFADARAAGVTRVSLGVQALDNSQLRFLGRTHGVAEAEAALAMAQRFFERTSFDLIYGRPGQSVASWRQELARALALAEGHLSAYQLTIEPGTVFQTRHVCGELSLPDSDTCADLYEVTQEILEANGLPAYEISNHARPGQECRHNLIYWQNGDWLGLGPNAHGRLWTSHQTRLATHNLSDPFQWLAQVEHSGHGCQQRETIGSEAQLQELLMMGLRLTSGIDRASVRFRFGRDVPDLLPLAALTRLIQAGLLCLDDHSLRATSAGRQRLNGVLAHLMAG